MLNLISFFLVHILYQPFFNLLVVIYYLLQRVSPDVDMGMAVILFTIVFRIIILPLSLSTNRSENEKNEMLEQLKQIRSDYKNQPIKHKEESKKIFKSNRRIFIAELFDIGIQVLIALMLYRIFSTGLEGADFNLLYHNVPRPQDPFNLLFLGKYDLSHPNTALNVINSIVIFIAEALNIVNSRRPITREDKMALFIFPVLAFIFFAYMPAGKKLFVITTLLFSIALMVVQLLVFWYHRLSGKLSDKFYSNVKNEES